MNSLRTLHQVLTTASLRLNRIGGGSCFSSFRIPTMIQQQQQQKSTMSIFPTNVVREQISLLSSSSSSSSSLFDRPYQLLQGARYMSKYLSKSRKKNIPLTTKRARKGFYKGKGATTEGRLNSTGRYIVNPLKRLLLVVPDISTFRLKPYIASSASRFPPEDRHNTVPS